MLRLIFISTFLLYSFKPIAAQFSLGAKSGLSLSKIGEQLPSDYSESYYMDFHNPQLTFGLWGQFEIKPKWSAQVHLDYSKRGSKVNNARLFVADWKLLAIHPSYIDINPMLNFKPTSYLSLDVGGFYSYLLHNSIEAITISGYSAWNDADNRGQADFGWNAGFSFWFQNFVLSGKYFHAYGKTEAQFRRPESSKHRMLQLTLGYQFQFKQ